MSDRYQRPRGALLAGVCAAGARRLGWNVWAIRALLVLGLLIAPLMVGGAYLAAAVVVGMMGPGADRPAAPRDEQLQSVDLESRGRRIAALEKRFRALEREDSTGG